MGLTNVDTTLMVWQGRSLEFARTELLDPTSWAGAIQEDVIGYRGVEPILPTSFSKSCAMPEFVALFMVKDEDDIIGINLSWLYYLGVRRFIVIDNNSADLTRSVLIRFRNEHSDCDLLIVDDPIVMYAQSWKMTGIMRLALSIWPDCQWVLPVDADEFFIPEAGLAAILSAPTDIDALVIPKTYHYILKSTLHDSSLKSFFSKMPLRTDKYVAPPKLIVRARADLEIGPGNHTISSPVRKVNYGSVFKYPTYIREFSIRGYKEFRSKVINGGIAIAAAEAKGLDVGGLHWKERYQGFLQYGESFIVHRFNEEFIRTEGEHFTHDYFPLLEILDKE